MTGVTAKSCTRSFWGITGGVGGAAAGAETGRELRAAVRGGGLLTPSDLGDAVRWFPREQLVLLGTEYPGLDLAYEFHDLFSLRVRSPQYWTRLVSPSGLLLQQALPQLAPTTRDGLQRGLTHPEAYALRVVEGSEQDPKRGEVRTFRVQVVDRSGKVLAGRLSRYHRGEGVRLSPPLRMGG